MGGAGADYDSGNTEHFNNFAKEVITAAIESDTKGGRNIKKLTETGFWDFTIIEQTPTLKDKNGRGNGMGSWPATESGLTGSTIHSGLYDYERDTGRWNQIETLLHELLHASEQHYEKDQDSCTDINTNIDDMMKDPEFLKKVNDILKNYPAKGLIKKDKGLVDLYE
jgi:hypothetical protein